MEKLYGQYRKSNSAVENQWVKYQLVTNKFEAMIQISVILLIIGPSAQGST